MRWDIPNRLQGRRRYVDFAISLRIPETAIEWEGAWGLFGLSAFNNVPKLGQAASHGIGENTFII
jgi:hypothetical protein